MPLLPVLDASPGRAWGYLSLLLPYCFLSQGTKIEPFGLSVDGHPAAKAEITTNFANIQVVPYHSRWFRSPVDSVDKHGVSSFSLNRGRLTRRIFWGAGLVATACALMLATAGAALSSPPLVDQYTEEIPTAAGPQHSGGAAGGPTSNGGGGGTTLPPGVQSQITSEGGKDAKKLKEIATSPAFGAPATRVPDEGAVRDVQPEGALSAAVGAISDGSDGRLIGLFVALVAIAAAALGLAAARRQRGF
jgi:hypothetical protein